MLLAQAGTQRPSCLPPPVQVMNTARQENTGMAWANGARRDRVTGNKNRLGQLKEQNIRINIGEGKFGMGSVMSLHTGTQSKQE